MVCFIIDMALGNLRLIALLVVSISFISCVQVVDDVSSNSLSDPSLPSSDSSPISNPGNVPTPIPAAIQCRSDAQAFPAKWNFGANCAAEPAVQVHRYDANTFMIRQSLCSNFEAPFLYMLFGNNKVLLQDTGAGGIPIVSIVNDIINTWLAENNKTSIELVVINSHGHGDHVGGNAALNNRPNTVVVGTSLAQVTQFFSITNWPNEIKSYDLGGRMIDIIPIPGHQAVHTALYDHQSRILLTGDTVYPGRLYIANFNQYRASIDRLATYVANKQVCHVLGTHIEMTATARIDFAAGSTFHPNERILQLSRSHLLELQSAVLGMAANPVIQAHNDFIVYPL